MQLLRLLIYVLLVAAVAGAIASLALGDPQGIFPLIALEMFAGLTFVVAIVLAILVHELGHVIAGHRAGMSFMSMFVGEFGVKKGSDGKLAFFRVRRPWAGGMVMMNPPDEGNFLVVFRRFIQGGPTASLIWSAVTAFGFCLSLAILCYYPNLPSELFLLVMLAHVSAALIFLPASLTRKSRRGLLTDGYLLQKLRQGGAESERLVALLELSKLASIGERARDWDPKLIEKGLRIQDGSPEEMGIQTFAYSHAMDCGRTADAEAHLAQARSMLPQKESELGPLGQSLLFESALCAARSGDSSSAREFMERVKKPFDLLDGSRHKSLAAILIAEGRKPEALEEIALARQGFARLASKMPGDNSAQIEELDAMQSEAEG